MRVSSQSLELSPRPPHIGFAASGLDATCEKEIFQRERDGEKEPYEGQASRLEAGPGTREGVDHVKNGPWKWRKTEKGAGKSTSSVCNVAALQEVTGK